ncbi:hypothetical protein MKEN_00333200 [Mycena kentingensis (nom. inval.)]|nr:hypothetical protein MKEN_00333200 [Mycena kentingensis (nom. inval.)]
MRQADQLATRRSRRSTAGNRMQAAMAEMALEQVNDQDDAEFANDKDEEDEFDDDFASTASETEEPATTEAAAQEDDTRARKAARTRLEKAAHARNKATFDPHASQSSPKPTKRKVAPISVETQRQSKRKHTAAQESRKPRLEARTVTQAELIARALDAEDGNIVEHREYLQREEAKRQRVHVARQVINGPLLRWVSRAEQVQVAVPQPTQYYAYTVAAGALPSPDASTSTAPTIQYYPYTPAPIMQMEKSTRNYVVHEETQKEPSPAPGRSSRNHETEIPKPSWGATMTAMFGSHVYWDNVQVLSGANRPLGRPTPTCPISGKPARYRDPHTGVPFANAQALDKLKRLNEYVWSPELEAYTQVHVQ